MIETKTPIKIRPPNIPKIEDKKAVPSVKRVIMKTVELILMNYQIYCLIGLVTSKIKIKDIKEIAP